MYQRVKREPFIGKTKAMRFIEFRWHYIWNQESTDRYQFDSDNSFDRHLRKLEEKQGRLIR